MVCKFKSRLYINPGNGYTVAEYSSMELDCIPSEAVISNYGTEVTFTAFGKELPCMDNVEIGGRLEKVREIWPSVRC